MWSLSENTPTLGGIALAVPKSHTKTKVRGSRTRTAAVQAVPRRVAAYSKSRTMRWAVSRAHASTTSICSKDSRSLQS
jgi:hypothetical protein